MTPRDVVLGEHGDPAVHTRAAVSTMLLVAGVTFVLVGLADMALLWLPANPGSVAWEYATVGRTLDAMPMSALGLVLVGYGVLRAPRPTSKSVMFVAAIFLLYAAFCAFLAFLLFTSAPAVISRTPAEAADAVRRAATRHGVQSVIYPLAWATVAVVVWRAREARAAE